MTIIEAFKTGLLVRRPKTIFVVNKPIAYGNGYQPVYLESKMWKNPEWLLHNYHLTIEDILADDWEVKGE